MPARRTTREYALSRLEPGGRRPRETTDRIRVTTTPHSCNGYELANPNPTAIS